MKRREFLGAAAMAGAGTIFGGLAARSEDKKSDDLNIAIIGVGRQGKVLLYAAKEIPGIRFRAVCDIWEYNRTYGQRWLKKYGHEASAYEDFREMLEKEGDLDAVIVATPDFVHAEHVNAALRAGTHVFCEAPMSNDVGKARSMVRTMLETGRLCQVGHQRRSNPRYIHVFEKLLGEARLCGRISAVNCHSGRSCSFGREWSSTEKYAIPKEVLAKYGYGSMREWRNWSWFKKYGTGPFGGLGTHLVDVCDWFLGTRPASVMATGTDDAQPQFECCSDATAIFEFDAPQGKVRALCQVITTGTVPAYFEHVLGDEGSVKISQSPEETRAYRDPCAAPDWQKWVGLHYLKAEAPPPPPASPFPEAFSIPVVLDKPWHAPHLQNFFDAVRGKAKLHCPADQAFPATVATLKVTEAIAARRAISFDPAEFEA